MTTYILKDLDDGRLLTREITEKEYEENLRQGALLPSLITEAYRRKLSTEDFVLISKELHPILNSWGAEKRLEGIKKFIEPYLS